MKSFFKPLYFLLCSSLLLLLAFLFFFRADTDFSPRPFRVACDPHWNGLATQDKDEELATFFQELFSQAVPLVSLPFFEESSSALLPSLSRGAVDGIITSLTPPADGKFICSDPLYDLGSVLIVRSSSSIESSEDLKGHLLGIMRGSASNFNYPLDPSIFVITFDNVVKALEKLREDSIDALLLPLIPATTFTQSLFQKQLRVVFTSLAPQPLYLVALKNERGKNFISAVNGGLKGAIEGGDYKRLLERWSLPDPFMPQKTADQ